MTDLTVCYASLPRVRLHQTEAIIHEANYVMVILVLQMHHVFRRIAVLKLLDFDNIQLIPSQEKRFPITGIPKF